MYGYGLNLRQTIARVSFSLIGYHIYNAQSFGWTAAPAAGIIMQIVADHSMVISILQSIPSTFKSGMWEICPVVQSWSSSIINYSGFIRMMMRTRKRPKDMYDPSPGNLELKWVSECVLKGFPTAGHYPKVSLGLLRMSTTTGWICGWVDDMAHLFMSNKAKLLCIQ